MLTTCAGIVGSVEIKYTIDVLGGVLCVKI